MKRYVKVLAIAACIGMFLVLLAGSTVTKTGSGRGCGDDWPLCNGKFLPAYTIESMIEYSHRIVTGVVGIVIVASSLAVFANVRRRDARIYAAGGLFFTFLQAVLGAMQVKNPQSSEILALHFGFALIAFTFTLMLVVAVRAAERESKGLTAVIGNAFVPRWFGIAAWVTAVYAYIVVYTGAYVVHTKSGGGCLGFPLCNNQLVPSTLEGATAVAFTHRTAAYILFLVVLILALIANFKFAANRSVRIGSRWALAAVIAQIASGALLMVLMGSDSYVFGTLLHSLIIALLFAVLVYIAIAAWGAGRRRTN